MEYYIFLHTVCAVYCTAVHSSVFKTSAAIKRIIIKTKQIQPCYILHSTTDQIIFSSKHSDSRKWKAERRLCEQTFLTRSWYAVCMLVCILHTCYTLAWVPLSHLDLFLKTLVTVINPSVHRSFWHARTHTVPVLFFELTMPDGI